MIRQALEGRASDPSVSFSVLLYTYCKTFGIDPHHAKHTPLNLMMEMLMIHGEVEKYKSDDIERESKRMRENG